MTKIFIVEDEKPAAKRLSNLIMEIMPETEIVDYADSVQSATEYLLNHPQPDLMMLDIQLGDGISFDIFKQVKINCPVIFTTAYDEYAIKAFELNSIDYLLKPVSREALAKSIEKFETLRRQNTVFDINTLIPLLENSKKAYKKRFLISIAERLVSIDTTEIAYFTSFDKNTFLVNHQGMYYAIDLSLDTLDEMLDPQQFFRVNRQFIVSVGSIDKIHLLSRSRLKIKLKPTPKEDVLVSNARTHQFREWLDK